jgi:steroid delta-isomerase-like uncharacterized protein
MTRDEIVALFDRRLQAWVRRDAVALAGDHSDEGVVESPIAGGAATGREAIQATYDAYFRAFPDFVFEQEDLLVEGDRAVLIASVSGTDRGGFMGLPPSGRAVRARAALWYTLRDGQIVHERRIYDFTGVLVQVGAIRAKPL